ncbi:MAG: ribosome assembly cofactor RimP [Flavobacteriales bacterium]|nr:ribosome assembly cofactor RimP [Flavobacteriales bacterium]
MIFVIRVKDIEERVLEHLKEKGGFLVSVEVSPMNDINISFDKKEGATSITDCVSLSRALEGSLDREKEDFKLNVSSPGLSEPFKVKEQYEKYMYKEVVVKLNDGEKFKGVLLGVNDEGIELFCRKKVKIDGKRKWEETKHKFNFNSIKETKVVILFK